MSSQLIHISKLLSLILRHQPQKFNVVLDENGYTPVKHLLAQMNNAGTPVTFELLQTVVTTNDKKCFALNNDKTLIRASQGHSITVDLQLKATQPPPVLYHGTVARNLQSIFTKGLQKQQRQQVHLSTAIQTAVAAGSRYGKPVILTVDAAAMYAAGFHFYLSANNVWLTSEVPPPYLHRLPA